MTRKSNRIKAKGARATGRTLYEILEEEDSLRRLQQHEQERSGQNGAIVARVQSAWDSDVARSRLFESFRDRNDQQLPLHMNEMFHTEQGRNSNMQTGAMNFLQEQEQEFRRARGRNLFTEMMEEDDNHHEQLRHRSARETRDQSAWVDDMTRTRLLESGIEPNDQHQSSQMYETFHAGYDRVSNAQNGQDNTCNTQSITIHSLLEQEQEQELMQTLGVYEALLADSDLPEIELKELLSIQAECFHQLELCRQQQQEELQEGSCRDDIRAG